MQIRIIHGQPFRGRSGVEGAVGGKEIAFD
jgi:hypothetical protein